MSLFSSKVLARSTKNLGFDPIGMMPSWPVTLFSGSWEKTRIYRSGTENFYTLTHSSGVSTWLFQSSLTLKSHRNGVEGPVLFPTLKQ